MIKDVAKHSLGERGKLRGQPKPLPPRDADREVEEVAPLAEEARAKGRSSRAADHTSAAASDPRAAGFEMGDPKNGSIAIC